MGSQVHIAEYPQHGIVIRKSTPIDCVELARLLREEDVAEIRATGGKPLNALQHGQRMSRPALTVEHNGVPALMFGVVPAYLHHVTPHAIPSQTLTEQSWPRGGSVWLLGSNDLETFSRKFLRHSREWLAHVEQGYDYLFNAVDARNEVHIRWIKWLGFTGVAEHTVNGHLFYEFARITPCVSR